MSIFSAGNSSCLFLIKTSILLSLSTLFLQVSQANDCTNGWRDRVATGTAMQGELQVTATFSGSGGITHQGVLLPGTDSRMTIQ